MPRSAVINASKPARAASASNAPLAVPDQPICTTVRTSNVSGKCLASVRGIDSSSSSFIVKLRELLNHELDQSNRLFTLHRRIVLDEVVEPIARFEMFEENAYRS